MGRKKLLNLTAKDWFEKGRQLARDGCHADAIDAFNRAITEVPAFAEAYFARGACCYALGSYHQAADDIDAAAILGCREAQFWSSFDTNTYGQRAEDDDE